MSDLKSVKVLSSSTSIGQDDNNLETNKYLQHPLIISLRLTPIEFRRYAAVIKTMVDDDTTSIKLIRDQNGNLKLKSTPVEQIIKIDNIRKNYLIRSFSDDYLGIMLNHHFFPKVDPTKATLLRRYKTFVETTGINHGLYVYGKVGIGKTYTSIALANELANIGKKIAFVFIPEAIHDIKSSFNSNSNKQIELEEKMKIADVLFLDDIGIEDASWFYNEHLLVILNYRLQYQKLTFFTSNLSLSQLEKKLTINLKKTVNVERLLERIRGLTKNEEIELQGINKRY